MNPHLKGSVLIVASMFFFALSPVFIRIIKMDVSVIYAYYELLFLCFFVLYLFIARKRDSFKLPQSKSFIFFSSVLIVGTGLTYSYAVRLTSLANVIFTHYTSPIFALMIAIIFLKEKFDWQSLGAVMLSLIGLLFS